MKIRGLLVAVMVLLVLGGVLYWSNQRKAAEETVKASAETAPPILKLDQSSISKVEIKKKAAEPVVLTKAASGDWQITAPQSLRADQGSVSSVVSELSSLNSERVVEDKAANLKTYGLDQPGLEVDVTQKDNKDHRLLIGDDTPTGSVYAMVAGDPRVFTLSSFGKGNIDKGVNDLRDKRLITASADKISRLELIHKNQDIEFGRNKDEWQILKPKPLRADNSAVDDLVRKLTDARMDLTVSDAADATKTFAQAIPVATAKVTDQSGTQELQVRKKKDDYYAKSSVAEGAFKVSSDVGQALDKGLEDFRNKKLFDFGFSDPNKFEIHNGSKSWFLDRKGEDWWWNGKKMDSVTVQSIIGKLRDLSATKFADTGFDRPTVETSVTSNDGKRLEKVSIAKSGNGYLAKREGEPTVYELNSSAVDDLLKSADELKPAAAPGKATGSK